MYKFQLEKALLAGKKCFKVILSPNNIRYVLADDYHQCQSKFFGHENDITEISVEEFRKNRFPSRGPVPQQIHTRVDFATKQANYWFVKLKNCEKGGGNIANSYYAKKFAQAIRIENFYVKQFTKWLNS